MTALGFVVGSQETEAGLIVASVCLRFLVFALSVSVYFVLMMLHLLIYINASLFET